MVFRDFNVMPSSACSSLLDVNRHFRAEERVYSEQARASGREIARGEIFDQICATVLEKRRIPCVSLELVIGTWLGGAEIAGLQIDAQGMDFEIVRSAGLEP